MAESTGGKQAAEWTHVLNGVFSCTQKQEEPGCVRDPRGRVREILLAKRVAGFPADGRAGKAERPLCDALTLVRRRERGQPRKIIIPGPAPSSVCKRLL